MSGTTTSPTPTVASRIAEYGVIIVSVLVLVVYLAAFAVAYYMKDDKDMTLLIGTAIANATTAVGYWLGSSQGSAKKTDMLNAAPTTPTTATQGPTP